MSAPVIDRDPTSNTPSDGNNGHESKKWLDGPKKAIAAVLGVAALAGIGWGVSEATSHKSDITAMTEQNGQDAGLGSGNGDTVKIQTTWEQAAEGAKYEDFFGPAYTNEVRLNWAYGKLDQPSTEPGYEGMTVLEAAHKHLADEYNVPGGYVYVHELVKPSENMTGKQINDLTSSIGYVIVHDKTMSDNDRVKLLAAVVSPDFEYFDEAVQNALNRRNLAGLEDVLGTSTGNPNESPVFSKATVGDYITNGYPSKVMNTLGTTTTAGNGAEMQVIYRFIDGKPVLIHTEPLTSSSIDPKTIHD